MNNLTCVSFHKAEREQPSVEVGNFVANLPKYLCAKNYQRIMRFDKVIAKVKSVPFFASHCKAYHCVILHDAYDVYHL